MVEAAGAARGVEGLHRLHQLHRRQVQLLCQAFQRVGPGALEHRRHEAAHRLGVDDRVAHLPGLQGHQPAPDGVALGPEVLALVVEAMAVAVDHNAQ
jgi:hypothetical protein